LIVNIKDTAVLSVIAVSDLFYSSKFIITANFRPFEVYFIICIIYLILTMTSSFLLRLLEKRLKVSSHIDIPTSQTTLEVLGPSHEK
jgi:putative lysine transport system permease protein